jgi:HemY protein
VPELVAARAHSLVAAGAAKQADTLLRDALKREWHDDLVFEYGALDQPPASDRLKRVENWLQQRPEDPVLLLVAARLCVATELWGKARSYYESSVAIRPQPQTWHELGQLLLQLDEQEQAFGAFQQGLTQSYGGTDVPQLPDASMEHGQPES